MKTVTNNSSRVRDIVSLTREVVESAADDVKFERWYTTVHEADAATLVDVTARLSSDPGKHSRDLKALREAIISEIERKNAQDVIVTMEKLDAAASKLTWVSLLVAAVGAVVAVVQTIQAFRH